MELCAPVKETVEGRRGADKIKTSDFYYDLPQELIAQDPLEDRSSSRLMHLSLKDGSIEHRHFTDVLDYLEEGDCLVINDTKVIPARLYGHKEETGALIEILLLKRRENDIWECLVKPGKKARPGAKITFGNGILKGEIIENIVLPFNGTLISRQVITSIGLPNENYFIWGDEVDYTERARKAGAQIFTVTSSKFFHPKAPNVGNPMFFGLLRYNDPNTDLKLYCYCRNNFANQKKYRGPLRASLFFFKSLWYYSLTRPSLRKLSIALKGLIAGCKGDFSHHCNFLK